MDIYLKQRFFLGIAMMVISIFIATKMLCDKQIIGRKKLEHKNFTVKLLYTRIVPLIFVLAVSIYALMPVLDIIDVNKYTYETIGVLNGISTSSNKIIREYTIKLNNKTYYVPKALISHSVLQKGKKYKVNYHKYSRVVYKIQPGK